MPTPTYTRRFAAQALQAPGTETIFTADLVFDYVLRDVVIANQSQSPAFYSLYVQAGTQVFSLMVNQAMPAGTVDHWVGRQRLLSEEELRLYTDTAPLSVIATGYGFTPPV